VRLVAWSIDAEPTIASNFGAALASVEGLGHTDDVDAVGADVRAELLLLGAQRARVEPGSDVPRASTARYGASAGGPPVSQGVKHPHDDRQGDEGGDRDRE
jgi:hypothetical protein